MGMAERGVGKTKGAYLLAKICCILVKPTMLEVDEDEVEEEEVVEEEVVYVEEVVMEIEEVEEI